jgi:MFS family permease
MKPGTANLRRNFAAAVVDAAGWGLGMALISDRTVLPYFIGQLTPNPVAIGAMQALMLLGWFVPGILVAARIERLRRVKASVLWIAAVERVATFAIVPLCLWLGPRDRGALLVAFLACWAIINFAMGANTPGYFKLIAKTIPPEARGRLYGLGGALSGLLGTLAAPASAYFLGTYGFPGGYAACFFAAAVVMAVSVAPLGLMREPDEPPTDRAAAPPRARPLAVLREDPRLAWVSAALCCFSLTLAAGGFYTAYATGRFDVGPAEIAAFTAAAMVMRTAGNPLLGWLGDRQGNRRALLLATGVGIGAPLLALAAPGLPAMYAVFALSELALIGWGVCGMNYVLELCPPSRSATYSAVYHLVIGPFRGLLPLCGGVLAATLGYGVFFGAAALGAVFTMAILVLRVPEPRDATDPAAAGRRRGEPGE